MPTRKKRTAHPTRSAATSSTPPQNVPRGRPKDIVVFREPSERNVSNLTKVLKIKRARGTATPRAGTLALRPKRDGHAATIMYERLGVAVADLSADERNRLLESDRVESIVPNETRSLPPIPELNTVTAPDALSNLEAIPSNPTLAYLQGIRFAADLALQAIVGGVVPSTTPLATPQSGQMSWCLNMLGMDPQYNYATGRGISVAVLDTGIDLDHPDFRGRLIENVHTSSFVQNEDVRDLNGHGTHCAGTIAGPVQSASGTRYGVAPEVQLLVGKVLGGPDGVGYDSDVLDAIDWAADQGARVISMSLGTKRSTGSPYPPQYERIASNLMALSRGPLLIAAAGNESARPQRIAPVGNPAACPSIMAVGAIDSSRHVAWFSCGGVDAVAKVDVCGPGVGVLSAWKGGGFKSISGTSMATPHVAGVAALLLQIDPALSPKQLWKRLTDLSVNVGPERDYGTGLVRVPSPV